MPFRPGTVLHTESSEIVRNSEEGFITKTFVKNKLLTLETAYVNVYQQDKGYSWFPQGGGRGSHWKWGVTEMPGPKCEVKHKEAPPHMEILFLPFKTHPGAASEKQQHFKDNSFNP